MVEGDGGETCAELVQTFQGIGIFSEEVVREMFDITYYCLLRVYSMTRPVS